MECFRDATLFGLTRFEFLTFLTQTSPYALDFQEEEIEIGKGFGLNVNINCEITVNAGVNFR